MADALPATLSTRRQDMPEKKAARVLIGDDHALVAQAIQHLLEPEFEVLGVVHDGRQLIDAAERLHPDVVLVDIGMPKLNGLDAAERICRSLPATRIIYLTMNADPIVQQEAMARGASAFLPKTTSRRELCEAIHRALAGVPKKERFSSETTAATEAERIPLTDRQRDVLQLLAEGLSMKQVGDVLHLATRTVAFHKYRIMDMLGLKNDSELVQFAIRKNLVFLDGTRGAPDRTFPESEKAQQRSKVA
jgi:DNA-binding NarL/FixJ family response regulator